MSRSPRRSNSPVAVPFRGRTGPPPGPEVLPWYWHPNRYGSQPPPQAFADRLREIDPDLRVCFSPVHERWLVWVKSPRSVNTLCTGWRMLFLWEHPITKAFLPLNELIFHNLFFIDANRWGTAKAYYDRIETDLNKERDRRRNDYNRQRDAEQREFADMHRISSAAPGNRAALHHDGTLIPSPGHQAYLRETRKTRLPSEMIRQEEDEKEKRFYGR